MCKPASLRNGQHPGGNRTACVALELNVTGKEITCFQRLFSDILKFLSFKNKPSGVLSLNEDFSVSVGRFHFVKISKKNKTKKKSSHREMLGSWGVLGAP